MARIFIHIGARSGGSVPGGGIMKKFGILTAAVISAFLLAACGSSAAGSAKTEGSAAAQSSYAGQTLIMGTNA